MLNGESQVLHERMLRLLLLVLGLNLKHYQIELLPLVVLQVQLLALTLLIALVVARYRRVSMTPTLTYRR